MPDAPLFHLDPVQPTVFAWLEHASWFHYVEGYEEAARLVLEATESDEGVASSSGDRLAYPLVFLCRQAVELRLKELIETGNRCLGTDEAIDKPDGHNLVKLWASCRRIILAAWPSTPATDLDSMEVRLREFQRVDPGTASRYPWKLTGDRSLPSDIKGFSLRAFVTAINEVTSVLDGADVGIDTEHEVRMEMRREMAEYNEP